MSRGARTLARSIRNTAHDVANRKQSTSVGIVRAAPPAGKFEPLRVELGDAPHILDENDLSLGQSVRRYHLDKGLVVGDSLVLAPLPTGDWVAHDVLSKNPPPENLERKTSKPKVTGSRGGNAALKNLLTALDTAGLIKDETTP